MALPELEKRLEEATGPDRDLDGALASIIAPHQVESDDGDWWWGPYNEQPVRVPEFTSSIDAAVALAERVLPWWCWSVSLNDEGQYLCEIAPKGCPGGGPDCEKQSPALALCLAIVRALIVKDNT